MNIVLGAVSHGELAHCASGAGTVADALAQLHDGRVDAVHDDERALILVLSDGGNLSGRARTEQLDLVTLGYLLGSAPDWPGPGSPLDDADRTASYLLDRFERLGTRFLDGVAGDLVCVVWDRKARRLVLASTSHATRSLFVRVDETGLVFGSNVRELCRLLGSRARLDRSREDFVLLYGFVPGPATLIAGVEALGPGTVLEWSAGRVSTGPVLGEGDWSGRFAQATDVGADEDTVIDALYQAFLAALSEQLPHDDRCAVLLGGFDSALVAAGLHRLGKQVETFSFWYREGDYNQPHTDTVSRYLGSPHHWIEIDRDLYLRELQAFTVAFNQVTNWPNYVIQTAHLCDEIRRRGFRVCYTGDGCDTIFLGYPGTWRRARVIEALPRLPGPVGGALTRLLSRPTLDRRLGHPYRVAMNLVRSLARDRPARGFVSFRVMDEVTLACLRTTPPPEQAAAIENILHELAAPYAELPPLRLAYAGKSLVSPNKNKLVGSSDRSGLAILSPYLHGGMKKLAAALPESVCRPDRDTPSSVTGKYILMRMAEKHRLLPKEVIYQPKVAAVDAPVDEWYAGPLRGPVHQLLGRLPFDYDRKTADALIDQPLAERLFKRYLMTDKVISHAISLLITYAAFSGMVDDVAR